MRVGEEGRGREGPSCLLDEECGISTARSGNESPERPQLMETRALAMGWLKDLPEFSYFSLSPVNHMHLSTKRSLGARRHVTAQLIIRSSPIPGPCQGTQPPWLLSSHPR